MEAKDIVITLPRTEAFEKWLRECEAVADDPDVEMLFRVPTRPLRAVPGESRCYVTWRGFIRGYHVISSIKYRKGFICSTTGKEWPTGIYIGRKGRFHKVPPMRHPGFQGWRYF
jgi:hypothetical protein